MLLALVARLTAGELDNLFHWMADSPHYFHVAVSAVNSVPTVVVATSEVWADAARAHLGLCWRSTGCTLLESVPVLYLGRHSIGCIFSYLGRHSIECKFSYTLSGREALGRNGCNPDIKVHGANMGPTWVLSAPDGPHVGPMNFAIREATSDWLLFNRHLLATSKSLALFCCR